MVRKISSCDDLGKSIQAEAKVATKTLRLDLDSQVSGAQRKCPVWSVMRGETQIPGVSQTMESSGDFLPRVLDATGEFEAGSTLFRFTF